MYQDHVSRLSAWVSPYPPSYGFLVPFGWQHSLLDPSFAHWGLPSPLRFIYSRYRCPLRPHWGFHVSHVRDTTGEDAFSTAGTGCPFPWWECSRRPLSHSSSWQPFRWPFLTQPHQRFISIHPSSFLLARLPRLARSFL